jgi:hypothetical protein
MECVPCLSRNCTAEYDRDCLRSIEVEKVAAEVRQVLVIGE